MTNFDYEENARLNHEKRLNDPVVLRSKEICESEFGAFRLLDEFVMHIRLGRQPDYINDIELEPMLGPEGINDILPFEQRQDAMKINRRVMKKIYERYHVNPVLAIAHIRFRSNVTDIRPARFMGADGIGYTDDGSLNLIVEQIGRHGLKFVEKYDYSMRENPLLEVDSSRVELSVTSSPESMIATPYRFEFGVQKIMGSMMKSRRIN